MKPEPIVISPAEERYQVTFELNITDEERSQLATLVTFPGWSVMLRILTTKIRVYESMLADCMITNEQKLSVLAQWNATKNVFAALEQWPTRAATPDDSSAGGSAAIHTQAGPRLAPVPPRLM